MIDIIKKERKKTCVYRRHLCRHAVCSDLRPQQLLRGVCGRRRRNGVEADLFHDVELFVVLAVLCGVRSTLRRAQRAQVGHAGEDDEENEDDEDDEDDKDDEEEEEGEEEGEDGI